MHFFKNSSIAQYHGGVYDLYPTFLPGYHIKTVDLDFNICKKIDKRCHSKGLGKQLKAAVTNHYYRKIKKVKSKLKLKICTHENPKPF